MTRVGAEERLQPAYNVYTKPLWADKSETIYRARESEAMKYVAEEAMKYVAEEAMKQAGLGDSLSKQADAEEAKYQSQSKRGGPLEVGMPGGCEVVHRRRDQSKWKEEKEGGGLMCLFEQCVNATRYVMLLDDIEWHYHHLMISNGIITT